MVLFRGIENAIAFGGFLIKLGDVLANTRNLPIDLRVTNKTLEESVDVSVRDDSWNKLEPESFEPALEECFALLTGLGNICPSSLAVHWEGRFGPEFDSYLWRTQRFGALLKTADDCVYVVLILEHEYFEIAGTKVVRGGAIFIELDSAETRELALEHVLKSNLQFL